ncbi:MAG: hypothetical protein JO314_01980 [Acidobacteria bacterium]|nr:hypothetical protein [Acidobacteriota bacterium]
MGRTPEEKLLNPRPGSKIADARDFGIDLTLTAAQLRLSPQQRIDSLQAAMRSLEELARARDRGPVKPAK